MKKKTLLIGLLLLFSAFVFTLGFFLDGYWFDMMVKVRDAVHTHDSGPLIIASAMLTVINAMVNTLIFMCAFVTLYCLFKHPFSKLHHYMVLLTLYAVFTVGFYAFHDLEFDWLTQYFAVLLIMTLPTRSKSLTQSVLKNFILTLQIFFAFQWLNVISVLARFGFGSTDTATSIKRVALYLENNFILDFLGLSFFLGLLGSSLLTVVLFVSFDRYLRVSKRQFENEKMMRAKVLENRVFEEVNALTHDLKTPLVTIQGLASLLALSRDGEKITLYADRIESATIKMSDMISSFLYDTFRQKLTIQELFETLRAQLPVHDKELDFALRLPEEPVTLWVNKVRIVRAFINLVENAILVERLEAEKKIVIRTETTGQTLTVAIEDNGIGIPKAIQDKIFEIGFSSKGTTGLGLAFAKKVVEDHEGQLTLKKSAVGGTCFEIKLPIYNEGEQHA